MTDGRSSCFIGDKLLIGTTQIRFAVFERDGFQCRYCGRSPADGVTLHLDHILPKCAGGTTTMNNLVTACMDCNHGKGNALLERLPPDPCLPTRDV